MLDDRVRRDLLPPGRIAWLDISAATMCLRSSRTTIGPLALQIAPLRDTRAPYAFRCARLRGRRCVLSAATVSGAELSRPAQRPSRAEEPSVHVLIRADSSGSLFDPIRSTSAQLSGALLTVRDPSDGIRERFPTPTHLCTLNVPAAAVGIDASELQAMSGRTYALTTFQGALVRSAVSMLASGSVEFGSETGRAGFDRYLGALTGLLLRTTVPATGDDRSLPLRRRAEAIVRERASDTQFTPAMLAAYLDISLRQLYRTLSLSDGPAALIRERRLEHAAELLTAPREEDTIESIAHQSGFGSAEYFSRAFRRKYGLSPRAFRSAHRARPHSQR